MILVALYFFLPAYCANMAPVFVRKIPFLAQPINAKYLGKNKTWRGLIAGTLVGGLVFLLQELLYTFGFVQLALVDYNDFWFLGFAMGFGALVGDAVKSYYKRKAGIAPGKSWLPFDQVDFALGGIVGSWLLYVPPAEIVLWIVVFSPLLHLLFNYFGYCLKLCKTKW